MSETHKIKVDNKYWKEINELRRGRKYSWNTFFKHLYNYKLSFKDIILSRATNPSICVIKSSETLISQLPKWCKNVANNMQDILSNEDVSTLICKTKKDQNCYKLDKLLELKKSTIKKYTNEELSLLCEIPLEAIDYYTLNVMTCDFNFAAGSIICHKCKNAIQQNKPALIISGGPSLQEYNHLDLLKQYGFDGDIFVVGKVLKECLDNGIIPQYTGAVDAEQFDTSFFDHEIVDKYSDDIKALFCITIHPTTVKRWKGKKYFYSGYVAENEFPNLSHVFHLLTKTSAINAAGNIGSCLYNIAVFLGYNPIVMIGMDLSFPSLESMCSYYSHTTMNDWKPFKSKDENGNDIMLSPYKTGYNPYFKKKYFVESVYDSYRNAHLSWINAFTVNGIKTYNCSGRGALYGKNVISMKFEDYLKEQKRSSLFKTNL